MEQISKKIRVTRLTMDFKQEYMAEELDMSQSAYSRIERGQTDITISQLRKIAKIFDTPLSTLIVD
jgi:transcriptional regulator with XRE-family HTH domain